MISLLLKIKSKYALKNIFDYISFNIFFDISYGSKKLLKKLDITKEVYHKYCIAQKLLKSSNDINKCFNYLYMSVDIKKDKNYIKYNESDCINQKIFLGVLNKVLFNPNIYIEKKGNENILKYVHNSKLIISPKLLEYLNNLQEEKKQYIFNLLNMYKNNIAHVSFYGFNNENKINLEIINQIINVLKNIFELKQNSKNIKDDDLNYINNTNKVIQLSFEQIELSSDIDIINHFLNKIDKILFLNKIKGLSIDSESFDIYQFRYIIEYIIKNMSLLEDLKIMNFDFNEDNYNYFKQLYNNINIKSLDLSNSFWPPIIIPILKSKNTQFKTLKLILYFNEYIDWSFLNVYKDTLTTFEIKIKENNNYYYNIDNMIYILNKMKKLKELNIIGGVQIKQLIQFKNKQNIEIFNVDLNFSLEDLKYEKSIYTYFNEFKNLKSLTITNKDYFYKDFSTFIFPQKLICLSLININGYSIISLLKENYKYLLYIEEFKIESSIFNKKEFDIIVNIFTSFKSLIKLSLNEIYIQSIFLKEKYYFYQCISSIFKNIPTLIELDISNNKYTENIFKSEIFEKIRLSIPKNLICLKINNNQNPLSLKNVKYLYDKFGPIIDLDTQSNKD